MTVYNNKTYRIEAVDWSKKPTSTFEVTFNLEQIHLERPFTEDLLRLGASKRASPTTTHDDTMPRSKTWVNRSSAPNLESETSGATSIKARSKSSWSPSSAG